MKLQDLKQGDIIKDKYGRYGTVVGITRKRLTVVYNNSTWQINFTIGSTCQQADISLISAHEKILTNLLDDSEITDVKRALVMAMQHLDATKNKQDILLSNRLETIKSKLDTIEDKTLQHHEN